MAIHTVTVGQIEFAVREVDGFTVVRAAVTDDRTGDVYDLLFDAPSFLAYADAFQDVATELLDEARRKGSAIDGPQD